MSCSIIVVITHDNRNSIPPLLAAVEKTSDLQDLNVRLLKFYNSLSEMDVGILCDKLVKTIENELSRVHRVLVCLSIQTPHVIKIQKLTSILKSTFKDRAILIAGGPHASGDPYGTLKLLNFDVVVVGEGEYAFPKLLHQLINHGDVSSLEGIAFINENGGFYYKKQTYAIRLDDYPPYSLKYKVFSPAIEIMRGCIHGCKFCQTSRLMGFKPRYRSINSIVKTVEVYVKEFGWSEIRFVAPNGLAYGSKDGVSPEPSKIRDLLEAVSSVNGVKKVYLGTFPSEVRPESVTPEVLEILRKYVANKRLSIGIQSGSNVVLQEMSRGHDVETGLKAVKYAKANGFIPYVDILMGVPGEGEEEMKQTINLIKTLIKDNVIVRVHTFMPLPGTPWWWSPAGVLPAWVKEELESLKKEGHVEGDYEKQAEINEDIDLYRFKLRKLLGL